VVADTNNAATKAEMNFFMAFYLFDYSDLKGCSFIAERLGKLNKINIPMTN